MPLNSEDLRQVRAERDASPVRFQQYEPNNTVTGSSQTQRPQQQRPGQGRTVTEATRTDSSTSSVQLAEIRAGINPRRLQMTRSRTITNSINTLERHPTALGRIETHRDQHYGTVGASEISRTQTSTKDLPNFGAGKPYPPPLPEREEYVVEFDGVDDPMHAQNWPIRKKLFIGGIVAFDSLSATMGSSIFSDATSVVSAQFGVGSEVGILATSLFVLGYAFGPLMWGPMSELYGRRIPILIAGFGYGVFAIAVATAPNLQTIMIGRFFGGVFGSCPLAVVGAIMADMFDNKTRGLAIAVFSVTVFMGPLLAPFIGGFIVDSYLGWRWTEYISAIMGFFFWILCVFFLEETYPPVILVTKAADLRRRTKNWGIHAKQEEVEVDLKELLTKNVSRPFRILFTEPIVLLITIYMSFIYGLLYLFLTAYAVVFQEVHGFNRGVGGLPYFGMVVGELIGFAAIILLNPSYTRKLQSTNNIPVPEWRLPLAIAGGISFSAGLFWFGWTGYTASIPWIVPTLSGLLTGFGIFTIFLQLLNYIIDAYLMFAASAIAANTFLRSLFGCVFPLFATYMFDSVLGVKYTLTLLGCVAALLVPMPILFYYFGRRIRARSKMAPALDIKMGVGGAKKPVDAEKAGEDGVDDENNYDELVRQETIRSSRSRPDGMRTMTNGSQQRGRPVAPPPMAMVEKFDGSGDEKEEAGEEYEDNNYATPVVSRQPVPAASGMMANGVHPAQRSNVGGAGHTYLEYGASVPREVQQQQQQQSPMVNTIDHAVMDAPPLAVRPAAAAEGQRLTSLEADSRARRFY